MIKSLLAGIVAVALIVGALWVRTNVIESDGQPEASGDPVDPDDLEDVRVVCDSSLGTACPAGADRLDVGELLSAFATSPVEYEVLVAPGLVVDLVEQSRTARVGFSEARDPIAVSPVVLATAIALDEQVADACGAAVTWACAARLTSDGVLRPAVRDARDDSIGLVGTAALTGGFLDTPSFAANALGGPDFLGWLDALDDQASTTAQPIQNVIQFNAAQANAGIELEATGLSTVVGSARQVVNLSYPMPLAVVGVVAVAVDDTPPDVAAGVGEVVGPALVDAGWRSPDGAAPALDAPAAPPTVEPGADDGLPNGGTLFSLRERLG